MKTIIATTRKGVPLRSYLSTVAVAATERHQSTFLAKETPEGGGGG